MYEVYIQYIVYVGCQGIVQKAPDTEELHRPATIVPQSFGTQFSTRVAPRRPQDFDPGTDISVISALDLLDATFPRHDASSVQNGVRSTEYRRC